MASRPSSHTAQLAVLVLVLTTLLPAPLPAQVPPGTTPKAPPGFELHRWAREPMLRSPVALAYDDQGRLHVAETARRSTVDIDIRSHPSWVVDDLANQSVEDLRRFFQTRMSPELSAANASWLRDLNQDGSHDWRDLTMVREKVHILADTRGTGSADQARVFAEGFNEEINGVIAGVLPWGDDVFVTIYPDLWRLRDTNGDGIADRKESVFRGFGVHAAFDGHDLHGLTVGHDGKLYFSVGDNGFSVTNREGRRLHHPNTGGVLRMNPDGSDLEVFATGLRNPQEIAFDELGNLFTVDNDGDLADERERFVFIAEGSDSGWRLHWQFREEGWARHTRQPTFNPWIAERMWVPHFPGQPAHLTPPLTNYSVGPGSFVFNPGTALTEAYRGAFFLIQFPVAKVTSFKVQPRGAGFEMTDEHTFVSGMMASCLAFSPDGALAIGDWDGLWAPSGKGSIWRADAPSAALSPLRQEVRQRLAQGPRQRTIPELSADLAHPDRRIRLHAQFELVRRQATQPLLETARSPQAPQLARVHALWGLGQARALPGPDSLPFTDPDPHIRAQTARVAGNARLTSAQPALVRLLSDPHAPVRFQAAIALGKTGPSPGAVAALASMLAENADTDPFLRHAGVLGLTGTATPADLAGLTRHPSPGTRLAAVVALRRLGHPSVEAFLSDPDRTVQREAIRAIHDDDSIPAALPALARLAEDPAWSTDEPMMRRLVNANLRLGTEESASRLLRLALLPSLPPDLRLEALECLGRWSEHPALDRVQGLVRPLGPRDPQAGNTGIRRRFADLVQTSPRSLAQAALRIALENRIPVEPGLFADWAMSGDQPIPIRTQVLSLLAQQNHPSLPQALTAALSATDPALRLAGLRLQADRHPEAFLNLARNDAPRWSLPERQAVFQITAALPAPAAADLIRQGLDQLAAGSLPQDLALDVIEAAATRPEADLRERVTALDTPPAPDQPTARQRATLHGGDPTRGREVFRSHPNAQCTRCHDAGGEGQQVGPVLNGIGTRLSPDDLLQSLLHPSARIADGFATTSVTLRNGDELDGVRVAESPETLSLRLVNGQVRHLPRQDITHLATSSVSTMPPMGTVLSPFELRDLIAHLATLR